MAIVNGYVNEYLPNHHRATTNGMVYSHILRAEEKLGRPLKDEEVVHHINHNRGDNSPENILVFASNADHSAFHKYGSYYLDEEGVAHCSARHVCKNCGKPCDHSADFCLECYNILQRKVKDRPSRDELKEMIREYSFCEIGRTYGVSDNAVRKWCDFYKLPRKKSIIKTYSEEDWLAI